MGSLSLFTQTDTILNTGLLSVGGYSQASQAHKALSSTFYCGGEFIWRLIQDYRPFVARSSPQKVDIKIIKTCPNPRTHGAPPSSTEIGQTTTEQNKALKKTKPVVKEALKIVDTNKQTIVLLHWTNSKNKFFDGLGMSRKWCQL